ncbi:alpha/beta fold hydrolase [Catenulispora pinisilvae]|uniref:alpha/beta fold hydrolase n=1 Tax=Catenulispora pinisilvae TaxID=2705253 RepID=UPI001890C55C|nr:alpha/beta hydrolase [Catenulispora pinisilvae]
MTVDHVAHVRGLNLHYRETGPTDGPALVAVHGHPGRAHIWDATAAALEGFHVFALTQRGYGDSDRPGRYGFPIWRDDVFGFADALGLDEFVLLGHSMGGTVSALAAEQHPERLRALILEDTVPPKQGLKLPAPERPEEEPPYDWDVLPAVFDAISAPDPAWWHDLARITTPTLVLAGGATSHVPQDLLAEAAALMPGARLVTLEGAGHTPHRDAPERFLAEVRGFLADLGIMPAQRQ